MHTTPLPIGENGRKQEHGLDQAQLAASSRSTWTQARRLIRRVANNYLLITIAVQSLGWQTGLERNVPARQAHRRTHTHIQTNAQQNHPSMIH